ncbi:hypothetical protein EGW08_003316 [Elysia chlorotica]|uniref:Uncharacterized protein n=1 Tax=Elysia chlorotica TaxID=188477 RepID=A0A433U4X4_ELYCH|nr:hypothetical protein EGW08_003316 [Elysia chlorotica]
MWWFGQCKVKLVKPKKKPDQDSCPPSASRSKSKTNTKCSKRKKPKNPRCKPKTCRKAPKRRPSQLGQPCKSSSQGPKQDSLLKRVAKGLAISRIRQFFTMRLNRKPALDCAPKRRPQKKECKETPDMHPTVRVARNTVKNCIHVARAAWANKPKARGRRKARTCTRNKSRMRRQAGPDCCAKPRVKRKARTCPRAKPAC